MSKNLFHLDILGTSFSLQSDENPERMEKIFRYLKNKTNSVEFEMGIKDPLKNAIVSSIILVDELFMERQNGPSDNDCDEMERLTLQMIERIDKSLE